MPSTKRSRSAQRVLFTVTAVATAVGTLAATAVLAVLAHVNVAIHWR